MKKIVLKVFLVISTLNYASAQYITEHTYCIKLKPPTVENYFSIPDADSLPALERALYEKELHYRSGLLSRFGEASLANTDREIFRSVVYGAAQPLRNMQVVTIEKRDKEVELSVKIIRKQKDSTVLVHKKIFGLAPWKEFEALASRLFMNQPRFKKMNHPVHDGSITVYEGHLSGRYHFIERRVMSISDPALAEINTYLLRIIGGFFEVNCKNDTREN